MLPEKNTQRIDPLKNSRDARNYIQITREGVKATGWGVLAVTLIILAGAYSIV